ncbi:unannotated protein [freshwater metagenome]|uniref:Unannotated protein n=1 Tax=freshwater metagenome TaxID=449393 RepID=A0A6J6GDV1_9ZZZZ
MRELRIERASGESFLAIDGLLLVAGVRDGFAGLIM